jgi:RHS repeat-associated protein
VTSHGYTYDDAGRLATAKASRVGPAALGQWYGQSYSSTNPGWGAGASLENLEVVRDVSGATDYAYQGDRATSLSGTTSASLTYDHAGRAETRTAVTGVEQFTHDALDRLVKVSRGTQATEELLEYGPTGEPVFRKLGTRGTWYVGSVGTVTADVAVGCKGIDVDLVTLADRCSPLTGTVKVAAHVQVAGGRVASINAAAGTGQDPVASVLYYHRDLQGSVVATTTRSGGLSGAMGARYRYTPYGQLDRTENVTALSDSELGYTGGLRLGYVAGAAQQGSLLLLGARVYHAELKRWLVPDTVDGRRYTYAGGDPVNFVDPSGRAANAIVGDGGSGGGAHPAQGTSSGGLGGIRISSLMMNGKDIPSCDTRGLSATDKCYVLDAAGLPVEITKGDYDAMKGANPGSVLMDTQFANFPAQGSEGWRGHLMDPNPIREWHIGNPIPGVGGPMDPFEVPGAGGGTDRSQPPWGGQTLNIGWKEVGAVSFSFSRDPFNQFYFSLNLGVGLSLTGVNVSLAEMIPVTHDSMSPADYQSFYSGLSGGFSAFAGPGAATSVGSSGLVQQIGVGTPQVSAGGSYTWCIRGCP